MNNTNNNNDDDYVDETSGILIEEFLKIYDPDTGEVQLEERV